MLNLNMSLIPLLSPRQKPGRLGNKNQQSGCDQSDLLPARADTNCETISVEKGGIIHSQKIAALKALIVVAALVSFFMHRREYTPAVAVATAGLYLFLCAITFVRERRLAHYDAQRLGYQSWLEVGAYAILVALDYRNYVVFFALLFSIFAISLKYGYRAALRSTVAASLVLLSAGLVSGRLLTNLAVEHIVLSGLAIPVLGYALARWGGAEREARRGLELLNNVTRISNPRFGVERTLRLILEEVRKFYDADCGLLILDSPEVPRYRLQRADRAKPNPMMQPEPLPPALAQQFFTLPPTLAVAYNSDAKFWGKLNRQGNIHTADQTGSQPSAVQADVLKELAELLDAAAFLSVPLKMFGSTSGRLYVVSRGGTRFDESDLLFFMRVTRSFISVVENIGLVDRLASEAAEQERKRIARDLHDTTIQPFIGLRIGLAAVRQKLDGGVTDIAEDISKLLRLTEAELSDLRRHVTALRADESSGSVFLDAVGRFVRKFSDASGIAIELKVNGEVRLSDRLAAEVFQLIAEGLSNIRRHTGSTRAALVMECRSQHFILQIWNERPKSAAAPDFKPRSISERTAALGGELQVINSDQGPTHLHISIPL